MTLAIASRALLFDADGVLVDSDTSVTTAWTRWAVKWGQDPQRVLGMVHGRRSADTVALLIEGTDRAQALEEIDRFEVEDATEVRALPGAAELLAAVPRGFWAVVTSGTRALATARLTSAGLPLPDVLVTADDVPRGKPDPMGYLAAASALGQVPSDCVVLEDSSAGVAAGIDAGCDVIGVSERALDSRARVVVRDLSGLQWRDEHLHLPGSSLLRTS